MIGKLFELDEEQQSLAMEGFEPHTVASELALPHLLKLIDASLNSYTNNRFSDEFLRRFKALAKELLSEVSE